MLSTVLVIALHSDGDIIKSDRAEFFDSLFMFKGETRIVKAGSENK